MPPPDHATAYLPPHLQEICATLARGLLRLRRRTADKAARDAARRGESHLHFTAHQRGHAKPKRRRTA